MLSLKSKPMQTWKNWSGHVKSSPQKLIYPQNIEEVSTLIHHCIKQKQRLRVVGSGHSFTPLVHTNQLLVSLDDMQGIVEVNQEERWAEVWAGTKLKSLSRLLHEHGMALENMGDIDHQSIAGALSTGTHGTGVHLGNLSTQIKELTIVSGTGEVITCSNERNQNLFKAASVSLGALGIIVKVKLNVVPAYKLHCRSYKQNLSNCLDQLDHLKSNRNFEFFYYPHTKTTQIKITNETRKPSSSNHRLQKFKNVVLENYVFWMLSEVSRIAPRLSKAISKISASGVPNTENIDYSPFIYTSERLVKFYEMEYCVPEANLKKVVEKMKNSMDQHQFAVHFPIECRFVKKDDIWLSPSYQRNSAYIAVHMYKGMKYEAYFKEMESILQKYNGRPHWGKMHTLTPESLRKLYPKWDDFGEMRKQMDPYGIFLNEYLEKIFDINNTRKSEGIA
ncbi:D-arabinono-1,4-lactone oxidase [Chengkuizengella axinellae]|uniref:D-arabinono-1,4-lactone oxidase n=1 Tax=Chengkuizengella axinellae TaxID=3064388 RepID=A0ABT9J5Z1_9BACL|nr:D-arabinono-1,4-lactone oxidase [Chengkuizengella sp. 2205SS18-9]MDP5277024.1 D-arabinono-1,4-lactone oxidase [Chengkuizengella sp. 2205SS18-9]